MERAWRGTDLQRRQHEARRFPKQTFPLNTHGDQVQTPGLEEYGDGDSGTRRGRMEETGAPANTRSARPRQQRSHEPEGENNPNVHHLTDERKAAGLPIQRNITQP